MNKKIKNLALASYTNGNLDEKKVSRVIKILTKLELKNYIKILKTLEAKKNVTIFVPKSITKASESEFKKIFADKRVSFKEDKSLVAGIKIVDNDLVYEQNLKNNLNNIIEQLN